MEIRFDFSDLPALIGAFAYGPLAGVIVEFEESEEEKQINKN